MPMSTEHRPFNLVAGLRQAKKGGVHETTDRSDSGNSSRGHDSSSDVGTDRS